MAFIFPGQGAQYAGMGKDFFHQYSEAKQAFEEAEDILRRKLTSIIFEDSDSSLNTTFNSQVAIFVNSIAILRVIQKLFPNIKPYITSGLSLGEYSALVASGRLDYESCLQLVQKRAKLMNDACEASRGTMAVVLGLDGNQVEEVVEGLRLPHDLWVANYNSPGQVVISGTPQGVEMGSNALKAKGAKRVMPLTVHGAFHSGLMQSAENQLKDDIQRVFLKESPIKFVMNVPGDFVSDLYQIRQCLIKQVTSPVRWEKGIRTIDKEGVDYYLEIGCGKTLTGLNKRIGVTAPTLSIEKIEEIKELESIMKDTNG